MSLGVITHGMSLSVLYLGILFYYTGNFVHSQKMLSNQGSKAVFSLCSEINEDFFNCETLLSLFDTYVSNILNYGCEVWGYDKADDVEKVHFSYLKRILKVRCGVTGKLLNSIKSMYSKLQCCVKFNGHFSNFFTSNIGVIQDSLSPLLYSFYVNDMKIELINSGCQTYELKSLNLFLLVYDDDTFLFSENVDDLQKMINSVNICSNEYGLYINLLKTKIVIFRNRGHVKAEEKWFLNGNKIDVCNELMYSTERDIP